MASRFPIQSPRKATPSPHNPKKKRQMFDEASDSVAMSSLVRAMASLRKESPSTNVALEHPALLRLDPRILTTIFEHVFRLAGPNKRAYLYLHDLLAPHPLAYVCRQFAEECRALYGTVPLHISPALGAIADTETLECCHGMRIVYGDKVPDLSISVRVVQHVEWRSPGELLESIVRMPGIHAASQLLVPRIQGGTVASMSVITPTTLARKLAKLNIHPHARSKYIANFAPIHHANLFGWLKLAKIGVDNVTIRILGCGFWMDRYPFAFTIGYYRALPLVALLASIIATKPHWIKKITLAGVGAFQNILQEMWAQIPNRTPITGVNPFLDLLVKYPFADEFDGIKEMYFDGGGSPIMRKREGNLFGLRSSMQWQAMIMRARHDRNQPEWKFTENGWGRYKWS
ncbi:hypothetical protein BU26DRAFT_591782 [Trematosphaeria pertusa]|uniref:Uncharacterized protein n=1 Tax=Trematosphaeria pertusa TaxID=390896 RepID=A0A6A6ILV9_9PLEO|nr:uncharacterized protein BU26DRAFT_591782 [Trematosphaeria pertusa]KAF2250792.1 hypothetical protein BU26DRAFT_591782 [Trematosphaeria pertusa]